MYNDIFISYRNDPEGRSIGRALKNILEKNNYSVYFNPDEQESEYFTDELREAVCSCRDFVLIMTEGCLERLLKNADNDWLKEEIIMAHENHKHFVPILIDGVNLPTDSMKWPESLRFLHVVNYISFPSNPDRFDASPVAMLENKLHSRPEKGDMYRDAINSNPCYNAAEEYRKTEKAAESGDADALYELAVNCYYGLSDDEGGSRRDFVKAYECFRKLSEFENPYQVYAINMIGHMYYASTIPREEQSYEESYKRHLFAAESSDPASFSAGHHVAYMMSIGSGCSFDYDKVVDFFEKQIQKSGSSTKFDLAQFYMGYGQFKKAADLYKSLYTAYPKAAVALGKIYMRGLLSNPPCPDYFRAQHYFRHAIDSGQCDAEPYFELGRLYFNPTGDFPKDFRLAQKYFRAAADMGHSTAQYVLGFMYENGHVEHNVEKAILYHEMAAKQGNVNSCASLVLLYQQPEHRNYHRAFQYAKEAAETGMSLGEFYYANLLFIGRGCEADMNEAYKYYKRSYEHGFMESKMMMDKIDRMTSGKASSP